MSLASVIRRVSEHKALSFVCPILSAKTANVLVVQDDIPYKFKVSGAMVGWQYLVPASQHKATVTRAAQPREYIPYLTALPRFYVVALFRLEEHTWLVTPFNASDADQRGWEKAEPRPMHLVREAIQPLDVVDTRALGDTILYNQIDMRGLHALSGPDAMRAQSLIAQHQDILQVKRAAKAQVASLATLEGQIEDSIGFMGGRVVTWAEVGESLHVTWEWEGRRLTTRVDRQLHVDSIGFCADGTGRTHNLTTAVALLQRAVHEDHYAAHHLDLD